MLLTTHFLFVLSQFVMSLVTCHEVALTKQEQSALVGGMDI